MRSSQRYRQFLQRGPFFLYYHGKNEVGDIHVSVIDARTGRDCGVIVSPGPGEAQTIINAMNKGYMLALDPQADT